MGNRELRKVKEVNGYKVNHPFSFGNLFYSILTLILVGMPVALFFFNILIFDYKGEMMAITGFDLFKYVAIDLFQNPGVLGALVYAMSGYADTTVWFTIFTYVAIGQAIIMCLFVLVGLFGFIFFLISICKGYLRHPRAVKGLTVLNFVASILFGLSYLFMFVFDRVMYGGQVVLFVWFAMIPAGAMLITLIMMSITLRHTYGEVVYEADLEFHEDEAKEEVSHVTEVHEVTKIKYETPKVLPPNLTSIGGHAFAENQSLEVANVPVGIDKLGTGAFANCLKLKVVSLPESVKEIGANCFFNCVELARINYAGTKEQWAVIRRGSNWLAKAKTSEVVCVNGVITVNPYH